MQMYDLSFDDGMKANCMVPLNEDRLWVSFSGPAGGNILYHLRLPNRLSDLRERLKTIEAAAKEAAEAGQTESADTE